MDPRLEIETKKDYVALKGALVNSWQRFPATNVNNSSFQITCNPPNRDIAITRLVFKEVVFSWTVTGTNTSGGTLLNEGYYGPRALPLTCVTQAEQITINNDSITQAPIAQYWRALLRYRNDYENRWGAFSLAPSMLDQYQSYAEGAGTVRNPLGAYGDNSFEDTRSDYSGFTIDAQLAGNVSASGTLRTYEPILVSPFAFGDKANYYSAFAGIQNMSYNATLSNLSRILSLIQGQGAPAGQIVLNEPVVNITSASLLFNYLTPDPVMPIPRNIQNSFFSIISYPTRSLVPVLAGATIPLSMASIQVTSIPKRIYVYAKADDSVETSFSSDVYLSLVDNVNPISLTWNNNQFLSQASTQDLYNISVKNGCNMNYSQYTNHTGSVLALDFGTDIGLMSNQAPGCIGNYQLSLNAQFKNTSSASITPTLYVVVVYEGVFNVNDGACSHMIGVLSPSDILNAEFAPMGSYRESQDVYGGKFEMLKKALKGAHDYVKKNKLISKGLSQIKHPYAQAGAKIAQTLGYGMSGGELENEMFNEISGGNLQKPKKNNKKVKIIKNGMSLSSLAED